MEANLRHHMAKVKRNIPKNIPSIEIEKEGLKERLTYQH
jgi:hypothetical protein